MKVYVVGCYNAPDRWECLGIYSTFEAAVRRCKRREHFVSSVPLDEDAPEDRVPWPDVIYPIAEPGKLPWNIGLSELLWTPTPGHRDARPGA